MINDGLQKSDFDIDSFLLIGQSNMAGRRELGMPNLPFIAGEISEEIDEARWKISKENAKKIYISRIFLRNSFGESPRCFLKNFEKACASS